MAELTNPDLAWACNELKGSNKRLQAYTTYKKYYDGDHPLAFATRKFRSVFWGIFARFADNLCESVVDIQAERLEIIGFTSDAAETQEQTETNEAGDVISSTVTVVDEVGDDAWDAWEDSSMDLVADEVHKDALLYGDGFTIVGDDGGVWPQEPRQMAVRYSEARPGEIEVAAKAWTDPDGKVNLNLYYADRVEHFKTKAKPRGGTLAVEMFAVGDDDTPVDAQPVSHFPNRAFSCYGVSELSSVLPLQDALNKSVIDTIVAMEYQAFRQRWATGVDPDLDENGKPKNFDAAHGAGEFTLFPGENVQVGEWGQMDVTNLQAVSESFRAEVARVSGIPLYYFYVAAQGVTETGEALKTSELRFTRKGKRQQRCFGKAWEKTMVSSLLAAGDLTPKDAATIDLNAVWESVTPRSDSEKLDVLVKKQSIGVPNSQLQKEAGYDPDQIAQFAKAKLPDIIAKSTVEAGGAQAPNAVAPGEDAPPGPAAPSGSVPQHGGAEPV